MPNILNKHLDSVGPQLAPKIQHYPIHFPQYLPRKIRHHYLLHNMVLPCEIGAEINSLPSNKALAGLYTCHVGIFKGACQTLSKPLAILIIKPVQSGIYHSRLKHAKIIPVFKNETNLTQMITALYHFYLFLIVFLRKLCISD